MRSSSQSLDTNIALQYGGSPVAGAADLNMKAGTVSWDRQQMVRGTCALTLIEPDRVPTPANPSDGLTPWGYAVVISAGMKYGDGTSELLQLGVFYLTDIRFNGVTGEVEVEGADRSMRIARARLEDGYSIAAGTNIGTAIQGLLTNADPTLTYSFETTSLTSPAVTIPAWSDPWAEATKMARDIGCELYIDSYDRCVLRSEQQQYASTPVWAFREGADGTLVTASTSFSGDAMYNRTIVTGSDPTLSFIPRGVATDTDPLSPIRYDGPHGRVPRPYSSPFIQTDDQAAQVASSIQASDSGMARAIEIEAVSHWALELGDVVSVDYQAVNVSDAYAMERFGFDLVTGRMTM